MAHFDGRIAIAEDQLSLNDIRGTGDCCGCPDLAQTLVFVLILNSIQAHHAMSLLCSSTYLIFLARE
jgi:hypothetical protein